jgi:hypothetical protein
MAARMDCAANTVMAEKKANTTQKISEPAAALTRPVPNPIVINIILLKKRLNRKVNILKLCQSAAL